ncbi:MAG: 8-oxo-(d)GTP phosphatase [Actinomycetota bacterium]|nr:8-oxo-(d)GTP phosphatase [Actinomycetota bacterium]
MSIYLVRHVKAGYRSRWKDDDRLRPVSKAGQRQARRLVDVLDGLRTERILSSPYVRSIESVAPLASVRGLAIELSEALAEEAPLDDALVLVRKHAHENAVLCSHGDVIPMLLEYFARRGVDLGPNPQCAKGSTWVLETDAGGEVVAARYFPPPPEE